MPEAAVGASAPTIELKGTDGASYALEQALARGPVLAAFFKVSCPTCQFTFPFLERLHAQWGNNGVTVWGISQDNVRDTCAFASKFGITFPLLVDDPPYRVCRQYNVKFTPTLFLIGADGQIELVSEGFAKRDLLEIGRRLANRLGVEPAPLLRPGERVPEFKPG